LEKPHVSTISEDIDIYGNQQNLLKSVSKTPGSIVHTTEAPAIGGGKTKKITEVIIGGYKVEADIAERPIQHYRAPGDTGPRATGSKVYDMKELVTFKVMGNPFEVNPKSWQYTTIKDKNGKVVQMYEHSDVQQTHLMNAFQTNLLAGKETGVYSGGKLVSVARVDAGGNIVKSDVKIGEIFTPSKTAKGYRTEKDTTRLLDQFENSIQTAKIKNIPAERQRIEGMKPGVGKKIAERRLKSREKDIATSEKTLVSQKEEVIRYRPEQEGPIIEVKLGDLQRIAASNEEMGFNMKGNPQTVPKVLGPLKSLDSYTWMRAPENARVDSHLSKIGQVRGRSFREKSLADIPYTKKSTAEGVENWLKKTGTSKSSVEREPRGFKKDARDDVFGEESQLKTLRFRSPERGTGRVIKPEYGFGGFGFTPSPPTPGSPKRAASPPSPVSPVKPIYAIIPDVPPPYIGPSPPKKGDPYKPIYDPVYDPVYIKSPPPPSPPPPEKYDIGYPPPPYGGWGRYPTLPSPPKSPPPSPKPVYMYGGRGIPPVFGLWGPGGGSTTSPTLSRRYNKYRETIRLRSMLW